MYLVTFHSSKSELLLCSPLPRIKTQQMDNNVHHSAWDNLLFVAFGTHFDRSVPLRAICQFWWLVKSDHVSVLRLRSHRWLKRFFLGRSATGQFFQTVSLAASCPASNVSGRLRVRFTQRRPETLAGTSSEEDICMKLGLFMCQTNMQCRLFCFTLCNFRRK